MDEPIASALERLDAEPSPAALRFDSPEPFSGPLAVLPSAFNPPTIAHQHLLESAVSPSPMTGGSSKKRPEGWARSVALLTTKNVDKGLHGAPLAARVGMLLALREDSPGIAVAASNQARIIDQAEALTGSFPSIESLTFIVGFDTLERLFATRYYTDMERELAPFFERHRISAANRGSTAAEHVREWIAANAPGFAGRIDVLEIGEYPASLSSTQVRESLSGHDHHPALSPAVRRYIKEHQLYGTNGTPPPPRE